MCSNTDTLISLRRMMDYRLYLYSKNEHRKHLSIFKCHADYEG